MPWSKVSDAPANIQSLNGVKLTAEQVNWIANVADGIPKGKIDNPWAVAVAQFKRSFKVEDGKWVKRNEEKKSGLYIEKQADGRYEIVAVSTVALPDQEGETFTTKAMDYDISQATATKEYPEFRAFHRAGLGIGKVTKMARVGMFAVDSGYSYDDPFSLQVCEKMLVNNDGRWKVSRGFRALEVSGGCPECGEDLLVNTKHMFVGFRCPSCGSVNMTYKGTLSGVQFLKTRTFDVTVTDVPAVMYTGVQAFANLQDISKELQMDKAVIKQKLMDAGIAEELIDERLKSVDDDVLKSLNIEAIPDAILLKEILDDEPPEEDKETVENVFEIDESTLKQLSENMAHTILKDIGEAVRTEVRAVLDGMEIHVDGMEGTEVEVKELPGLEELKEKVDNLVGVVEQLLESEEERLKQLLNDAPRNGRLRITRFKSKGKAMPEDEDEEDEEDMEDKTEKKELGVIMSGDGKQFETMTAMLRA